MSSNFFAEKTRHIIENKFKEDLSMMKFLKADMETLFNRTEELMNDAFEESGLTVLDVCMNTDKSTAKMIVGYFEVYNSAKRLCIDMADSMDNQVLEMEYLKRHIQNLEDQNEQLIKMLKK